MKYIEYRDREIAKGMKILHGDRVLIVEDVILRRGEGLALYTRCEDGYAGPAICPHPDKMVKVVSGVPPEVPAYVTSDYPHAEVQG